MCQLDDDKLHSHCQRIVPEPSLRLGDNQENGLDNGGNRPRVRR